MSRIVSIIMPCRNEAAYVERAVRDALAQEHHGFDLEILVAVGPSSDDTHSIVARLAAQHPEVRLVENPAGVVPHGLNAAIRAAKGSYIVRMDAHSRYPANYVVTLIEALERLKADNVGGVWETMPADPTDRSWAIAHVLSSRLGVGNALFRVGVQTERDVDTVPYGCFRRELFDRVGYFDEELVRNQDDEHNGRIIKAGGRIVLLPQVRIQYFSRDRIGKLWRMYREYGLFKPLVNLKLGAPATWRQFVPPLFVLGLFGLPVLIVLGMFGALWGVPFAMPVATLWCGMLGLYGALVTVASVFIAVRGRRLGALPWLLAAFLTVHVAYGSGYLDGFWRFVVRRKRIRPEDVATNR